MCFEAPRTVARLEKNLVRRTGRANPEEQKTKEPTKQALAPGLQLASILIALCLALLKVQSGRTAQGQAGTTGNRDAQHTNDTPSSSPVTLGERDKPHESIATYAPG